MHTRSTLNTCPSQSQQASSRDPSYSTNVSGSNLFSTSGYPVMVSDNPEDIWYTSGRTCTAGGSNQSAAESIVHRLGARGLNVRRLLPVFSLNLAISQCIASSPTAFSPSGSFRRTPGSGAGDRERFWLIARHRPLRDSSSDVSPSTPARPHASRSTTHLTEQIWAGE